MLAVIKNFDEETGKYKINYHFPEPNKTETLVVPPERLVAGPEKISLEKKSLK